MELSISLKVFGFRLHLSNEQCPCGCDSDEITPEDYNVAERLMAEDQQPTIVSCSACNEVLYSDVRPLDEETSDLLCSTHTCLARTSEEDERDDD